MDDSARIRSRAGDVDLRLLYEELPPFLVAGNRFGSYGFGAGLTGLLLAIAPFGHTVAWVLTPVAIVLGLIGLERYAAGNATNRDASFVAIGTGFVGLVVLLCRLAATFTLPPEAYVYYGP